MTHKNNKIALVLLILFPSLGELCFAQEEQEVIETTIIHAGTLLYLPGTPPKTNQSIIIENEKILDIRSGFLSARDIQKPDSRIIDLKNKFVMPGLMDVHVHLSDIIRPPSGYNEADQALVGVNSAYKTLMAGYTTVRDLGAQGDTIFKLRDAINKGDIIGPRIYAAGEMITVGSNKEGEGCNDAASCRRMARDRVASGADVIKVYASCSGRFLCSNEAGEPVMMDEEFKAIMDIANIYKVKVAAHSHPEKANQFVVDHGVASLEHGSYLSNKTIRQMKDKGIFYVPTAALHDLYERQMKTLTQGGNAINGEMLEHITGFYKDHSKSILAAYRAGVKIATGSDALISPHGKNFRELEILSEYGIPNKDVLKMATVNSAELLGKEAELGSIEQGKIADIIAVDGDPIEDIKNIENISFVMKSGKRFK